MKKILALLLAASCIVVMAALASCDAKTSETTGTTETSETEASLEPQATYSCLVSASVRIERKNKTVSFPLSSSMYSDSFIFQSGDGVNGMAGGSALFVSEEIKSERGFSVSTDGDGKTLSLGEIVKKYKNQIQEFYIKSNEVMGILYYGDHTMRLNGFYDEDLNLVSVVTDAFFCEAETTYQAYQYDYAVEIFSGLKKGKYLLVVDRARKSTYVGDEFGENETLTKTRNDMILMYVIVD